LFVASDKNAANQLQNYPQCTQAGIDPSKVHIAIRAAIDDYPYGFGSAVRAAFGMCLWFAIVIHIIGVEIYVRYELSLSL
jgi:hypothetical protein